MTLNGYVIIPPVNLWDDRETVIPHMSYRSFGKTLLKLGQIIYDDDMMILIGLLLFRGGMTEAIE
jgi:hypothetical protein